MKKLLFLVLLLLYQLGFSQQITQVQYWFGDNFAGRQYATFTTNGLNEIKCTIDFPDDDKNELNEYFHCRFKDSNDDWSVIYSQQMNNTDNLSTAKVEVQYWFDNDPIKIDSMKTLIGNNGVLDNQFGEIDWPVNAQQLQYRFKSSYNQWTSVQTYNKDAAIYQNNKIVAVEYWFGDSTDFNGPLDRLPVTITENNEISLDIPFPDNDTNELNETVNYRFVDGAGNWSPIFSEQMKNNHDISVGFRCSTILV